VLFDFPAWARKIEAALHAVYILREVMIRLTEWRAADGVTDIR